MFTPVRIISLVVIASLLCCGSAWAAASKIEGIVKDPDGHPLRDAQIRVEGKNFSRTANTDTKGHYNQGGLGTGTYDVTLLLNGQVKTSVANVQILRQGETTTLDFALRRGRGARPSGAGKNFVWVGSETGSHINGRWLEVDERGHVNRAMGENIIRKNAEVVKRIQDNSGTAGTQGQ